MKIGLIFKQFTKDSYHVAKISGSACATHRNYPVLLTKPYFRASGPYYGHTAVIILRQYGPGRLRGPDVGVIFSKKMFLKLVDSTIDGL